MERLAVSFDRYRLHGLLLPPGDWALTQEDPSGQTAGYLYVGDDPVNGTDPSGQEISGLVAAGIGIGLVGVGVAAFGFIGLAGLGAIADLAGAGIGTSVDSLIVAGVGSAASAVGGVLASIGSIF